MSKGVNQVRQSIAQRKKGRKHPTKDTLDRKVTMPFPQEEEKHGYLPTFLEPLPHHDEKGKFLSSSTLLKGVLSIILFFGVAILLQSNATILSKPKEWTNHVLVEEFPFARVNKWYEEAFGSPLTFTPQDSQTAANVESPGLPVIGDLTESFQANGSGIMIGPEDETAVSAWEEGVIIFAGKDADMKQMVIVQHADDSKSKYGFLSSIDVHLYQYVASGERIGTFNPTDKNETVYFSIEKNNQYIDPIQVIQVDDNP